MDFTKKYRQESYPTISPTAPENSQAGRTVLIAGGSEGIAISIANSFIKAKASKLILLARREDILDNAVKELQSKVTGKSTEILGIKFDQASEEDINSVWEKLHDQHIVVDVLVLSVTLPAFGSMASGLDLIWKGFEVNVLGNMRMTHKFLDQNTTDSPKVSQPPQ